MTKDYLCQGTKAVLGAFTLLVLLSARSSAIGPYFVTGLGVLPQYGHESAAVSINSVGQVVGYSEVAAGSVFRAGFLWTPTTPNGTEGLLSNLGELVPGGLDDLTEARGINARGQVVGFSDTPGGYRGYLWTPTTPNSSVGSMISLGWFVGVSSVRAEGINSYGQAVGYYDGNSYRFRAFLWTPTGPGSTDGSMVDIGVLPIYSDYATASAVNSFGQVVGQSSSSQGTHAFLWTPDFPNLATGAMVDLGTLPGGFSASTALGLNDFGQVVGFTSGAGLLKRGYLWTPNAQNESQGTMIDVGFLPGGDQTSSAWGVNSHGQVVGDSTVGLIPGQQSQQHHAFVWTPTTGNGTDGEIVDLNTSLDLASGAGWRIISAREINDRGQIVGTGIYDPDGPFGSRAVVRAVLLTPLVPEPTHLILIVSAASLTTLVTRMRYTKLP